MVDGVGGAAPRVEEHGGAEHGAGNPHDGVGVVVEAGGVALDLSRVAGVQPDVLDNAVHFDVRFGVALLDAARFGAVVHAVALVDALAKVAVALAARRAARPN